MPTSRLARRRLVAALGAPLALVLALPPGAAAKSRPRDGTAPKVAVASPVKGQLLSGTVTVSGSASDNVSLAKVEVAVDGGAFRPATGTTQWSFPLDTTVYASGSHTITARATDGSGNTSRVSVSVSFSNPAPDTTPPTVTVSSPGAGATLVGLVNVSGSASDNVGVTRVEVGVDGGAASLASGTSLWTFGVDTSALANGSHTLFARATDAAGNTASTALTVTVSNPLPDTTPPTVAILSPSAGSTVAGSISVAGTASDDVGLAGVAVAVDGGSYQAAQGGASWSFPLDTTALANGQHTLSVRATDAAGNAAATSETVSVQNAVALPPGISEQLVTPEGATIRIHSDVGGWTAQQIYDLLKANAYQLSLIGPDLTVEVQNDTSAWTATSAGTSGGVYTTFHATIYLGAAAGTVFADRPDEVVAHEYGHAWTLYHLYLGQQGSWTSYLTERGLLGDSRVDSSYIWTKEELIADDYRLLFGDALAQSEASYLNPYLPDPRTVPGLKDWFVSVWGA